LEKTDTKQKFIHLRLVLIEL